MAGAKFTFDTIEEAYDVVDKVEEYIDKYGYCSIMSLLLTIFSNEFLVENIYDANYALKHGWLTTEEWYIVSRYNGEYVLYVTDVKDLEGSYVF